MSLIDKQTNLDKGKQHHRSCGEQIQPEGKRQVLALPKPVGEGLARERNQEEEQREGKDAATAHNNPPNAVAREGRPAPHASARSRSRSRAGETQGGCPRLSERPLDRVRRR